MPGENHLSKLETYPVPAAAALSGARKLIVFAKASGSWPWRRENLKGSRNKFQEKLSDQRSDGLCPGGGAAKVRQPKPIFGVNLVLSGIDFFMINYKRVRHAFSENAG